MEHSLYVEIISAYVDILCDIDFESLSNYDRLNLGRQQSQIPEVSPTILKNSFFTLPRATPQHHSFIGGKTTYSSLQCFRF